MILQTQLNLIERMKSLLCFVFLSVVLCTIQKKANNKNQKVLLISLDGFRWNFREKTETPNLDKIVNKHGVSVEYVLNVFPTSTFPNHQSIVTGLYPENHGIIDNSFLNPEDGTIFNGDLDSKWWDQSTPIWIENQIQGHESGVCFWPGYQVNYKNKTPSYTPDEKFKAPYEATEKKDMELNDRLDLVIDWLKKDNVTFVALYTECVDETAHDHSPDSNETRSKLLMMSAINTIDEFIGTLQDKLEEEDLKSFVNVIMIGTHFFSFCSFLLLFRKSWRGGFRGKINFVPSRSVHNKILDNQARGLCFFELLFHHKFFLLKSIKGFINL